jgi:hypothetical protein
MCKLFNWNSNNGSVEKTVMSAAEVFAAFGGLPNTGPEDNWYFCADISDIMDWCYACRSECPPYTSNSQTKQGFDCDDFAACFAAYCRRKGYSNAVWIAWGLCDGGGHAWNVVQCPDGKYEIEPQTGEVWVFKSNPSYTVQKIK